MRKLKPDEIANAIKIDIVRGDLALDEPLVQEVLAKKFGVSRIPIREAIKRLETEGVLSIRHGEGTYIAVPSRQDVAEIFELRMHIEPYVLRLSMPRLGPRDFEAATELLGQLDLPPADAAMTDLDLRFHEALAIGADRRLHLATIAGLRTRLAPIYAGPAASTLRSGTSYREHEALLEVVKQGDENEASALLVRHLIRARDGLLGLM